MMINHYQHQILEKLEFSEDAFKRVSEKNEKIIFLLYHKMFHL